MCPFVPGAKEPGDERGSFEEEIEFQLKWPLEY